jgi:hypothetical protein
LSFLGGYGFATRGGEADEIQFGPIVELGTGKLLLTFNPFFSSQVGDNRQTDGLGPTLFWNPGSEEEEAKGGDGDEDNNKAPPDMELSFNVGVQFGLTDVTSDGALKFQGSLSW